MKKHLKMVSEIEDQVLELIEEVAEEFKATVATVDAGEKLCGASVSTIQLFTALASIRAQLEQMQELS